MKEENIIAVKSFKFDLRIVKLFMYLKNKKIERDLCLQLLRSVTSIGANIEEAVGGSSKKILYINWKSLIEKRERKDIGYAF